METDLTKLVWTNVTPEPRAHLTLAYTEVYEVRIGSFCALVRKVDQTQFHTPLWGWYVGHTFKYARKFDDYNGCAFRSAEGHVDTIEQAKTAALAALATALFIEGLIQ